MLRGLLDKIRLKWYEGVFLGAVVLVAFTAYLQSQRIDSLNTDLRVSEQATQQAIALYTTTQARQEIDQTVVATITQEVVEDRHQQRLDREELIRDYLIFKTLTGATQEPVRHHPDPTPTDVANASHAMDTASTRGSETQVTATAARSADTAHFDRLARGMRDTYCRAGGTNPACTASESD